MGRSDGSKSAPPSWAAKLRAKTREGIESRERAEKERFENKVEELRKSIERQANAGFFRIVLLHRSPLDVAALEVLYREDVDGFRRIEQDEGDLIGLSWGDGEEEEKDEDEDDEEGFGGGGGGE